MQNIYVEKKFHCLRGPTNFFLLCVLSDVHAWTVYGWHSNELAVFVATTSTGIERFGKWLLGKYCNVNKHGVMQEI